MFVVIQRQFGHNFAIMPPFCSGTESRREADDDSEREISDLGTGTWDLDPGTWDLGPQTWDLRPGSRDLEPGTWDWEPEK